MAATRVTAPGGAEWVVRRQWTPRTTQLARRLWSSVVHRRRRRRERGEDPAWPEWVEGIGWIPSELGWLFVVILAAVVAVLVFGVVAVVIDVVVAAVLVLAGVIARVVFRRPWTVEALPDRGERLTRSVVGWGASIRARDELVADLADGRSP